jgi:hypothetical protein
LIARAQAVPDPGQAAGKLPRIVAQLGELPQQAKGSQDGRGNGPGNERDDGQQDSFGRGDNGTGHNRPGQRAQAKQGRQWDEDNNCPLAPSRNLKKTHASVLSYAIN